MNYDPTDIADTTKYTEVTGDETFLINLELNNIVFSHWSDIEITSIKFRGSLTLNSIIFKDLLPGNMVKLTNVAIENGY